MGSITKDLSLIATYSKLHMRDSLGRPVRAVADNLSALLANYRFTDGPAKGLALNVGVTYTGRRAGDTAVNYTPAGVVGKVSFFLKPMYATTIGASYRWNDRTFFRLVVDNPLDDKNYIAIAGGRVTGTGLTTAPGTNVKFSTTIEF
jgi:iron complex outermembrane receptor protein